MTCKEGLRHVFDQMDQLLAQLSPAEYARPLELFDGSSLGQHFRHIIDFAECLLAAAQHGRPVDYAARRRSPALERDPRQARQALSRLLQHLARADEDAPLAVRADFLGAADVRERPLLQSTLGRELMFVHDHAVHHLAMIKMGIRQYLPRLEVDPALGVAPATLKFWQQHRHAR